MSESSGDGITAKNANWTFSGEMCQQFDSHVSKSVPLYMAGHDLILKLSDYFLHDDGICYDLGCSTGELLLKLAKYTQKKIQFIGVDVESDMVDEANRKCNAIENIDIVNCDLSELNFEKSDLIISYYTMQFTSQKNRQLIFDSIYKSLNWGGAFILFEKVRAPDARFQDIMTGIYNDYKLEQGYTTDEIINKSRSLKGVLEPFSVNGNIDLLKRAGFKDYMTILKYVSFEGVVAVK